MNTTVIEERVKAMSFDEFVYDLTDLSQSLKLISEMVLETAEIQRKKTYDNLHDKLESEWYEDIKYITSPDNYNQEENMHIFSNLKMKHNKLRHDALITLSKDMQESLKRAVIEVNDLVIKNWEIRKSQILKRRECLDETKYNYLVQLMDILRIDCKRILWVYQDKAFSQFDDFRKNRQIEIMKCKV